MLGRRHIFRTFLLMIWSTSRTLANTTDSDHNFTSENPSPVTVGNNENNVTIVKLRDNITNVDVGTSLTNLSVSVTNTNFLPNVTNADVDANAITVRVDVNATTTSVDVNATTNIPTAAAEEGASILRKIHRTVTRSRDAVWATVTLTFLCVALLLAVAQSRMWKDHHFTESQGVPLPDFNERVLFRDVMEHKLKTFKRFFKKKKKKKEDATEMESLLVSGEQEEEDDVVFQKDFSYRR